jgi:arylsulfatase A-like enzyme
MSSLLAWQVHGAERLNVVVFLIDDLGSTDLGCYGNTFHETPHLDRLARDGMRMTTGYSACTVCSPTRAALLTGQYPARLHITDWIAGHKRPYAKLKVPDWRMALPTEMFNLAKGFKEAGYATASVGKWHLGGQDHYPEKVGFDVNLGGTHLGSPPGYFATEKIPTLTPGKSGEFLTERLTDEAIRFITKHREKPFFIYFPHYAVHTPLGGKPEVIAKYQAKAEKLNFQRNATYAALVESVDDSVGRVRKALDDLKLADRTIILFTSDNGGLLPITTNPPFRVGKGSAYEGGVRVPLLIHWPGTTRPGSISDVAVITMDLLPTLAEACRLTVPKDHVLDGRSLVSVLQGQERPTHPDRELYWHYPHYHPGGANPYSAIRSGDWRLVEFFETGKVELYNLKEDVSEKVDRASKDSAVANRLKAQLAAWRKEVGAQLPTPNPDHDPTKDRMPAKPSKPKKPI